MFHRFPRSLAMTFVLSVACTADSRDDGPSFATSGISAGSDSGTTEAMSDATGKLDLPDSGGVAEIAEVFGHSADTLYRLNPTTKAVEIVGTFSGCDASIIDIALDADSNMYGTAYGSLWAIDRANGQCTLIAEGQYPTSLSFVPAGTVAPDEEAMVGFVDEQYIRIDVQTGAVTPLGTLADGLASSGDLVSVKNGGSYLTVRGPGCEDTDCIIEIDPESGAIVQSFGPLPYDEVFGLAFWAGRAYGFAREGVLFEIELEIGEVVTTPIQIPGAPAGLEFFGAGSTTSAPPAEG
jgi:hypothetical protein